MEQQTKARGQSRWLTADCQLQPPSLQLNLSAWSARRGWTRAADKAVGEQPLGLLRKAASARVCCCVWLCVCFFRRTQRCSTFFSHQRPCHVVWVPPVFCVFVYPMRLARLLQPPHTKPFTDRPRFFSAIHPHFYLPVAVKRDKDFIRIPPSQLFVLRAPPPPPPSLHWAQATLCPSS